MVEFLYFDLGNVVLHFDHHRACRQMAQVFARHGATVSQEDVWNALFASGLQQQYEQGRCSTEEVFEQLCQRLGAQAPQEELLEAACDIFRVNQSLVPLLGALVAARWPMGLLSNTNPAHWQWVSSGRFWMIPEAFPVQVLSFQVGALKPQEAIYREALARASVEPEKIFYVDDTPSHVAGAQALGMQAVQYTDTPSLVEELRRRGVEFNF